ncbi:MAG: hypothetical protein U0136_17700 [Bdellovibrionota bacterium]
MATSQPIQFLPPRLARYAAFPWTLFLSWIAIVVVITALPAPSGGGRSAADFEAVSVYSSETFHVRKGPSGLHVVGGLLDGVSVESTELNGQRVFSLLRQGYTVARATTGAPTEQIILLYDPIQQLKYVVSDDDDGFKVKDPDGKLVTRMKIKEEKFNVYGADDVRTLKGKPKKGTFVVRTEDESEVATLSFGHSLSNEEQLLVGGILSLPIDPEYRLAILAAKMPKSWK